MWVVDFFDIVGTAAFAISGVLVGVKNKLDLFGLVMLSIITASGGGLIRDVIISNELPVFFTQPRYLMIALISTVVCIFALKYIRRLVFLIQVFDAIGLGVFTVLAAYKGIKYEIPLIGIIFIACLTGIGGGIVRDILVNEVPMVFRSEIYALASIGGAVMFYILYRYINVNLDIYICIVVVFLVRILSIHFNWNLPVITSKEL